MVLIFQRVTLMVSPQLTRHHHLGTTHEHSGQTDTRKPDHNGPWQYKLSDLYYEPAVAAAGAKIAAEEHPNVAA
jgi:hypothetical protein